MDAANVHFPTRVLVNTGSALTQAARALNERNFFYLVFYEGFYYLLSK